MDIQIWNKSKIVFVVTLLSLNIDDDVLEVRDTHHILPVSHHIIKRKEKQIL